VKADLEALSRVLGRPVESFSAYSGAGTNRTLNVRLDGHAVLPGALRHWTPGVCVQCVIENGFIPAWSDLGVVDACPFHERRLTFSCGSCQQKLYWERRGLVRCKCGVELADDMSAPIDAEHRLLLLDIVDATRTNCSSVWEPRCEALAGCRSLAGVLATVRALAKLHAAVEPDTGTVSFARRAARIAAEWPQKLHAALARFGPRIGAEGGFEHLSRYRRGMLREFTRHLPAAELSHIRLAMMQFGGSTADSDALTLAGEEVKPRATEKKPRKLRVAIPDVEGALGHAAAGKFAELPQSVMVFLRRAGYLEVRNVTRYVATYNRSDVEHLFSRLRALPVTHGRAESISLRDAMRLKLFHADGKGELVAAVLTGRVRVRAKGEGVDLLLDRSDVDNFCVEARRKAFGGAITPTEAGRLLHCVDSTAVGLFEASHLEGHRIGVRNVRLNAESVASFAERFRSFASLQVDLGTSSNRLLALADAGGLTVVTVPGRRGEFRASWRRSTSHF
jgi:hypothetical protein